MSAHHWDTPPLFDNIQFASKNLVTVSVKVASLHINSTITSAGSCKASFNIFSIFLVIATFCWSFRGYVILLGTGPPYRIDRYTAWEHMHVC